MLFLAITFGLSFSIVKYISQHISNPILVLFWQTTFAFMLLFSVSLLRKQRLCNRLILQIPIFIISFFGVIAPWVCIYLAAPHISAGSLSLLPSLVPFCAFIIALLARIKRYHYLRALSLILGFYSVYLLIYFPETNNIGSLDIWILVRAMAPLFIVGVNVFVASARFKLVDPFTIAFGMIAFATIMLTPLVIFKASPYFLFWNLALCGAIFLLSAIAAVGSSIFMTLLKTYGPVFASQVNYLVTTAGVGWGIIFFSEVHETRFWFALVILIFGLVFIRPKTEKR